MAFGGYRRARGPADRFNRVYVEWPTLIRVTNDEGKPRHRRRLIGGRLFGRVARINYNLEGGGKNSREEEQIETSTRLLCKS